jgi:hypothetical protein
MFNMAGRTKKKTNDALDFKWLDGRVLLSIVTPILARSWDLTKSPTANQLCILNFTSTSRIRLLDVSVAHNINIKCVISAWCSDLTQHTCVTDAADLYWRLIPVYLTLTVGAWRLTQLPPLSCPSRLDFCLITKSDTLHNVNRTAKAVIRLGSGILTTGLETLSLFFVVGREI